MITYHGTDPDSANTIIGPPPNIDVTKGRGELGRGFYLGENISLAKAIAVGKYGKENSVVIKFNTDDAAYVQLTIRNIHRRHSVYGLWRGLVKHGSEHTYLFKFDVICAPFATIDFSYQYKFETNAAQNVLNNNSTKEIL